ncbi:hypothetical protein [Paenibacillus sp. LHD-38]|uniref:hypothetical protein n=1 Tax=Paenibacillus sp. LHD-38 TaxID=3072143 RepID=UPI00280EA58E|nr:hypothetical protein [Paenibacillus sp. LHD-38]MDQ8739404.1 hypothetical protein [Paenibacillus sp. LHD-38]
MSSDYIEVGLSSCMGPKLRQEVETQLLRDLLYYRSDINNLSFDWSDSVMEGHCLNFMDGLIQNFSGVSLYDDNQLLVADGWMDFITDEQKEILFVFWDQLELYVDGVIKTVRGFEGIPEHITQKLNDSLR